MENLNDDEMMKKHQNGRRLGGLVIVIVGTILLGKQMGYYFPDWLFSWPMLLIVVGIYIGAKHQFRKPGWIVMCVLGTVFLIDEFVPGFTISDYFWPSFIIVIGLFMIFSKKKDWKRDWKRDWKNDWHNRSDWEKEGDSSNFSPSSSEDYLNTVAVFGGIRKNIISKDFKGGEVVCVFSGAEINLLQSEIKGQVELELVNVFGGTKLIIPANWQIKSEVVAILGGIDDKRMQQPTVIDDGNILLIKGTTFCGGIEIKSY